MSGLKSGSGDDLWGDEDSEAEDDGEADEEFETDQGPEADVTHQESADLTTDTPGTDTGERTGSERGGEDRTASRPDREGPDDRPGGSSGDERMSPGDDRSDPPSEVERESADVGRGSAGEQPYIVRRAIRDKSVQFERDERLTFFVHRDVADGERELVNDVESTLGRSVPKFDVREAVYRAALRNPEDVLDELLAMGYTAEEE